MGDSDATFEDNVRVETSAGWLGDMFGAYPPNRHVRADARGLHIRDLPFLPRNQIASAYLATQNDVARVVVMERSGKRQVVHVRSRQAAEQLLQVLGFSATQTNVRFPLLAPFRLPGMTWPFAAFFALGGYGITRSLLVPLVIIAMALVKFLFVRFRREMIVGRDGVSLSRIGKPRFISYGDIESVNRFVDARFKNWKTKSVIVASGVVLHLRNQTRVTLPLAFGANPSDEAAGAHDRVADALAAWRGERSGTTAEPRLARNGRSISEWRTSLDELAQGETLTYRVAPLGREALLEIVEDPGNRAVSRLAAAVALGAKLDENARERLRVAAETTADPKLRVAIERVVAGEKEAELDALLDDLSPLEKREG